MTSTDISWKANACTSMLPNERSNHPCFVSTVRPGDPHVAEAAKDLVTLAPVEALA